MPTAVNRLADLKLNINASTDEAIRAVDALRSELDGLQKSAEKFTKGNALRGLNKLGGKEVSALKSEFNSLNDEIKSVMDLLNNPETQRTVLASAADQVDEFYNSFVKIREQASSFEADFAALGDPFLDMGEGVDSLGDVFERTGKRGEQSLERIVFSGYRVADMLEQIAQTRDAESLPDTFAGLDQQIQDYETNLERLNKETSKKGVTRTTYADILAEIKTNTEALDVAREQIKTVRSVVEQSEAFAETFDNIGRGEGILEIAKYINQYGLLNNARIDGEGNYQKELAKTAKIQERFSAYLKEQSETIKLQSTQYGGLADAQQEQFNVIKDLTKQADLLRDAFVNTYDPKLQKVLLEQYENVTQEINNQKTALSEMFTAIRDNKGIGKILSKEVLGGFTDKVDNTFNILNRLTREATQALPNAQEFSMGKSDQFGAVDARLKAETELFKSTLLAADAFGQFADTLSAMFNTVESVRSATASMTSGLESSALWAKNTAISKQAEAAAAAAAVGANNQDTASTGVNIIAKKLSAGAASALSTALTGMVGVMGILSIAMIAVTAVFAIFSAAMAGLKVVSDNAAEAATKTIERLEREIETRKKLNGFLREGDFEGAVSSVAGILEEQGGRIDRLREINGVLRTIDQQYADRSNDLGEQLNPVLIIERSGLAAAGNEYRQALIDNNKEMELAAAEFSAIMGSLPKITEEALFKFKKELREAFQSGDVSNLTSAAQTIFDEQEMLAERQEVFLQQLAKANEEYNAANSAVVAAGTNATSAEIAARENALNGLNLVSAQLRVTNAQIDAATQKLAIVFDENTIADVIETQAIRLETAINDFENVGDIEGALDRLRQSFTTQREVAVENAILQDEIAENNARIAELQIDTTEDGQRELATLAGQQQRLQGQLRANNLRVQSAVSEFAQIIEQMPDILRAATEKLNLDDARAFLASVQNFQDEINGLNKSNQLEDTQRAADRLREDVEAARAIGKELADMEVNFNREVEDLRLTHLQTLRTMEMEHNANLADMQKSLNDDLAQAQADFNKEENEAEEEFRESEMETLEDYQRGVKKAEEEFARQRLRALEDLYDQLFEAEMNNDVLGFLQAQRSFQKDQKRSEEDFALQQEENAEQFELDRQQRAEDRAKQREENRVAFEEQRAERIKQYQEERAEAIRQYEENLKLERDNFQKELEEKRFQYAQQVAERMQQYREEQAERAKQREEEDTRLRQERADRLRELTEGLDKEAERNRAATEDREKLYTAHAQSMAEINQQLQDGLITEEEAASRLADLQSAMSNALELVGTNAFDSLFDPSGELFGFTTERINEFATGVMDAAQQSFASENELLLEDLNTNALERAEAQQTQYDTELTALNASLESQTQAQINYYNEEKALRDQQRAEEIAELDAHFYGDGGVLTTLQAQYTEEMALIQSAQQQEMLSSQTHQNNLANTYRTGQQQIQSGLQASQMQMSSVVVGIYRQMNQAIIAESQRAFAELTRIMQSARSARPTNNPKSGFGNKSGGKSFFKTPPSKLSVYGPLSTIERIAAAEGAYITKPTLLLAGEGQDDEIILPFNKSKGISDALREALGGGVSSSNKIDFGNITVGSNMTREEVIQQLQSMSDSIIRVLNSAVND
jgi:hypothetical protein